MDVGILLVFTLVFLSSYFFMVRQKNVPPGPFCFPIVGSLQIMRRVRQTRPHLALMELSQKYGPVFSFNLWNSRLLVLSGYDVIHEALVKRSDVFSDRQRNPLINQIISNGSGVVFSHYNHNWKVLRRFTLQALRDFGVGKSTIEEKITTEIEATSKLFIEHGDKPIDINACMQMVVGNIVYGIVFGKRYDYGDPEFSKVRLLSGETVSGDGVLNLAAYYPTSVIKLINLLNFQWKQATVSERRVVFENIEEFIEEAITQHEATFDENNIRDFVDLHIKTSRDQKNADSTAFTRAELFRVINDLFLAGSETTSTSLDWTFLYMAEYPDVQKKCQDEIDEVLGDKQIQYADREKLPYVNATLNEIQRMSVIVPLSVSHYCRTDTEFYGYTIPAGTTIIPNLYSACMDPKYWNQPELFKPERFLDAQGKLIKIEAFIPFSTGPRQCLGEPLAKMELFMIFSSMLQRFSFRRENENIKHSMQARKLCVTNMAEKYRLKVKSRKYKLAAFSEKGLNVSR